MAWIDFGTQGLDMGSQRIGSDQRLLQGILGVGLNKKREAQEVQSGLEIGLMGICREKRRLTLLWIEWKSP